MIAMMMIDSGGCSWSLPPSTDGLKISLTNSRQNQFPCLKRVQQKLMAAQRWKDLIKRYRIRSSFFHSFGINCRRTMTRIIKPPKTHSKSCILCRFVLSNTILSSSSTGGTYPKQRKHTTCIFRKPMQTAVDSSSDSMTALLQGGLFPPSPQHMESFFSVVSITCSSRFARNGWCSPSPTSFGATFFFLESAKTLSWRIRWEMPLTAVKKIHAPATQPRTCQRL
mmetsp:Transcript_92230/g.169281  ORF Transcript_92230/g.169281 Transcript_92230/m.169281 type:complete len:224 (-) Transcript_92230:355-1026(-)